MGKDTLMMMNIQSLLGDFVLLVVGKTPVILILLVQLPRFSHSTVTYLKESGKDLCSESCFIVLQEWFGWPTCSLWLLPPGISHGLYKPSPDHCTKWHVDVPKSCWTCWGNIFAMDIYHFFSVVIFQVNLQPLNCKHKWG